MKKAVLILAMVVAVAGIGRAGDDKDRDDRGDRKSDRDSHELTEFKPQTLVLSRSVYSGNAATVTVGQVLPPDCVANAAFPVPVLPAFIAANGGSATTPVKISCTHATNDGTFPSVFINNTADGSFGVTSPIFLDNITRDGELLGSLSVDPKMIVTSFSSKSELALNRSLDKKSITFVGYVGGPSAATEVNQLDVSNSNTPGVVDPTNPVVSPQFYRSVAEVDASGHMRITNGNAYSGNNGRAAIKADWRYYMVGNDNNGGLTIPKKGVPLIDQLNGTQDGVNLINSTGVELLIPGQAPPLPQDIAMIGRFDINQVDDPTSCTGTPPVCKKYASDKPGKDDNFRGLTIHNNTLYVTKGSGGNSINTVYQVGADGHLPTGTAASLAGVPITILPGFPTILAARTDVPISFPFGIWFADDNTLYVCDEGDGVLLVPGPDGNVADAASRSTAGIQKWHFDGTTWQMLYVLQNGLNIGVPYAIPGYPSPATGGCRNIAGEVHHGIATIYAVTSTISTSGDQGADPNKLVKGQDRIDATTLSVSDGDHDLDDRLDVFTTIRSAGFGEVLRGVALAPQDRDDDDDRGRDDRDDNGRDRR